MLAAARAVSPSLPALLGDAGGGLGTDQTSGQAAAVTDAAAVKTVGVEGMNAALLPNSVQSLKSWSAVLVKATRVVLSVVPSDLSSTSDLALGRLTKSLRKGEDDGEGNGGG